MSGPHSWRGRAAEALLLLRRGRTRALLYKALVRLGLRSSRLLRLVLPVPVELMVEPFNACNLSCPTCPTGSGRLNRPPRAMTLAEFGRIIASLGGAPCRLFLWNYGEPLLNRDLPAMIRLAGEAGISCLVSTNGEPLLSPELCREIVSSAPERVIVCLDGADQESHATLRRGGDFAAVTAGVRNLAAARRAAGARLPAIELQLIVTRRNAARRHEVRRLAAELGADAYSEKLLGIDTREPGAGALAAALLPEEPALRAYDPLPGGGCAPRAPLGPGCRRLYSSAVINSDGSVVPCCYDVRSEHVMGNVFEQDLAAIWAGEKYEALRRRVAGGKAGVPMCSICMEGLGDLYVWRREGRP